MLRCLEVFLTHGTVVCLEARVSLLVREVRNEEEAEVVPQGIDDLLSWH